MARSFNGSTDLLNTATTLNLTSFNQITISFWLRWTAFANDDKLAAELSTNFNVNAGAFFVDPDSSSPTTNSFAFALSDGTNISNAAFTRPSAGVWHHYMAPLDGGGQTGTNCFSNIYVDGVSQSLTKLGVSRAATAFGNFTLYLMSRAGASLFGAGQLADFAIWGGVLLTQNEATSLARGARPKQIRPKSLVFWAPIDGLQSPEPNFAGSGPNATVTGTTLAPGPPVAPFTPRGQPILLPVEGISGARRFNGTNQAITLSPSLNGLAQLSVTFWLNWTAFANTDNLAMEYSPNYGSNAGAFIIGPNSGNPLGVFYSGVCSTSGNVTVAGFTRPSAGAWHNYVFTFDGTQTGNASIPASYIDGVSQSLSYTSSGTGFVAHNFGNYTLNLMSRNAASLFGAGSMANLGMWSTLLTQREATALAQGALPYQIRTGSLVSYLPLDGLQSPEPDLSGKAKNGTLVGAPAPAAGPPIMLSTPRWPQNLDIVAAPAFNPAWRVPFNQVVSGGVAT